MAEEDISWVGVKPPDRQRTDVVDEFDEREVLERLEDLEGGMNGLIQDQMTKQEMSCIIMRIESLEQAVQKLVQDKSTKHQNSYTKREVVLNAWSQCPSTPMDPRPNTMYEGDVQGDIQAIIAQEKTDWETAQRWKRVLLDRYGLCWGVDCGKSRDLKSLSAYMTCFFNIRARVLYNWGRMRMQILEICDERIESWKKNCRFTTETDPIKYRELCRLYYS